MKNENRERISNVFHIMYSTVIRYYIYAILHMWAPYCIHQNNRVTNTYTEGEIMQKESSYIHM